MPFTVFNVIFNSIPVYIGLRFLGRKFTILSIITIILSSVLTDLLPDMGLTQDPLLNCVFGGILYAFGSSLCLRADATTGGTDFIAMYMAQKHDRDAFGTIFIFNAIMLAVAGYLFGWDKAMYSIIYQFTVTQALHVFYKNYQKHTLFIITEKPADVYECIASAPTTGPRSSAALAFTSRKSATWSIPWFPPPRCAACSARCAA